MKLKFRLDGLSEGCVVRDIIKVWPSTLKDSFTQRKTYDEYYYEETDVCVTLEDIQMILDMNYGVELTKHEITISR